MKKYLFIIFASVSLMLISVNVNAQYWWWPNHQLIPTQDKTSNLCLINSNSAWEYQVDSATTAIYYYVIGSDPVCILFTPGVKYTNPKLTEWPEGRVFFETNINGNTDIYVIIVDGAGNPVGEMQPLVTSPANDHDFCYNLYSWQCQAAWLEEETLKTGLFNQNNNQFSVSDIETLDSLNCSCPAWFETLLWIKHMESFDVIRSSSLNVFGWTEPTNIDTAAQILSLKNTNWYYTLLQWTLKEDTSWFMKDYFYYPDYPNYTYSIIPDITLDHPFDFDVCNIGYGVKSSGSIYGNFFQAYIKNSNGYDEVFLNQDYDINTYYNFSNMAANCRNPQFFVGEYAAPSTFFFYLTWEAFVDSSWQIYYSKAPITWGGIEENENSLIKNLVVSPNPFHNSLQISFDLEKPTSVVIDLVDIHGRPIENIFSGKCDGGSISKQFNLSGNGFRGPCLVRFNIEGSYSFVKVIRTK
jgi:hypothetical protein